MVGIWDIVVALLDDLGLTAADSTKADNSYLFCDRYEVKILNVWTGGKFFQIYTFEDEEISVTQKGPHNGISYSVDIDLRDKDSVDRFKEIIISGI